MGQNSAEQYLWKHFLFFFQSNNKFWVFYAFLEKFEAERDFPDNQLQNILRLFNF